MSPVGQKSYEPRFHVVLYEPEIPQNTGNIGRTCLAAQAQLWLVRPLGFRVDDYHLKRAGMDYWQHVQWSAVDTWQDAAARLGEASKFWYFTKFAERDLWDASFAQRDVLVFGSESRGLPDSLRKAYAHRCLRLPMAPAARSLNLASAVAVALYEAWRQTDHRS